MYTTFYFGALGRRDSECEDVRIPRVPAQIIQSYLKYSQPDVKPHFCGIFPAAYGLDREKLEELNFMIKSSDPIECDSSPKRVRYGLILGSSGSNSRSFIAFACDAIHI